MDATIDLAPSDRVEALLARLAGVVPDMQSHAAFADANAAFPLADLAHLRALGGLASPLPPHCGGLGLGTTPRGATGVARVLRLLGRANLSLARIFEAHVNALRLIGVYGTTAQMQSAAEDVHAGHLFALWVTDGREPLRLAAGRLQGGKGFCSAAGHATRAVVTAASPAGVHLLVIPLDAARCRRTDAPPPQGMRAATTAPMDLDGIPIPPEALIGRPGDYLREPEFSAGAWRGCAAQLGGLDALLAEARAQLTARHRDDNPHQRARIGQALIAQETAALWVHRAALLADSDTADAGDRHAYVNLARCAVERACLDVLQLVQRSLGLAAFVPPNPVERVARDLATYLRQPAPDEALTDGAAWYMRHELPPIGLMA